VSVFGKGKKSDDSILEDAAAARERERLGKVAPEDQFEHTLDEIKDAPVKAKMAGAPPEEVAALRAKVDSLQKMMEEVINSQKRLPSSAKLEDLRQRTMKRSEIPVCAKCGQFTTVCGVPDSKGNHHVTLRVLPDRPEHQVTFPGVIWNSVVYAGICVVPAICADDILATVHNYSEYMFALGRDRGQTIGLSKKVFAEHVPAGGVPIFAGGR
jgi:hypothetical protein